ncbi:MAG: type II secretion system protein GspD [Phycisphaeraceae bacterium]|nr:MAG: type II secretion system protein GspD [Phycisphaeraceae bacterium]
MLDRAGNSIIFRGDDADAAEFKRFVDLVDIPSRLIIRRYHAGRYSARIASYGDKQGLGSVSASGAGGAGRARAAQPDADQSAGLIGSGFLLDAEEEGSFTYFGTRSQHDQVAALVEEFAEQVREAEMRVEFYKLKHARAADAADLINQLLDLDRAQTADSPFLPRGVEARGVRRIDPPQQRQPEPQPTRDPDRPATRDEDEVGLTPVEGIAIIPDEANNQLIIRAPQRQQREFVRIIDSLDQRRPQVYIEVQIVSVSASKQFDFSIDYALGNDSPGNVPIFTNFGLRGDPFTTDLPNPSGITAAVIRSNYIPVIVNMLQTEGDGRILSTPRILVNDNEEARLDSTRDEPFATTSQVVGAPSQTGLGGTLSAGTSLSVTPQVSEAGFLILDFEVELSSFGERPNPDLPPATDRNVFSSAITIPSDSTVVVGGFTRESRTDTVNKIPLLGDIPGIGNLFRNISKMNSTQTIYVFITPRVLRDQSFTDMRLLSEGPMATMNVIDSLPPLEAALMPLRRQREQARDEDESSVSRHDQGANDQAS